MKRFWISFLALTLLPVLALGQSIRRWAPEDFKPQVSTFQVYGNQFFNDAITIGTAVEVSSTSSGTPAWKEVSTLNVHGWRMTTADEVAALTAIPWDFDPAYNIAARVAWTSTSADNDGGIIFNVSWGEITQGASLATATVAGLADDIAASADSSNLPNTFKYTTWDTFTHAALSTYNGNKIVQMSVELDADGDAAADEVHMLFVQFAYVSKFVAAQDDSIPLPGPTILARDRGFWLKRN